MAHEVVLCTIVKLLSILSVAASASSENIGESLVYLWVEKIREFVVDYADKKGSGEARGPIQYHIQCFIVRSRKRSKVQDWVLKCLYRFEIWLMPQQQCRLDFCQISEQLENPNHWYHAFEKCDDKMSYLMLNWPPRSSIQYKNFRYMHFHCDENMAIIPFHFHNGNSHTAKMAYLYENSPQDISGKTHICLHQYGSDMLLDEFINIFFNEYIQLSWTISVNVIPLDLTAKKATEKATRR